MDKALVLESLNRARKLARQADDALVSLTMNNKSLATQVVSLTDRVQVLERQRSDEALTR